MILIIQACFYQDISEKLHEGATKHLIKSGYNDIETISVPGCFEIPAALSMAVKSKKYQGFITLGCVIRGETTHYDYVCNETSRGINQIAIDKKAPVGFGIITSENQDQAYARCQDNENNVGTRAAIACTQMIDIKKKLLENA